MTIIWKDICVKVKYKFKHIRKMGGKVFNSFAVDFGDVPVCRFNGETGKIEDVVNTRGRAYAARKRQMYRRNKKKDK